MVQSTHPGESIILRYLRNCHKERPIKRNSSGPGNKISCLCGDLTFRLSQVNHPDQRTIPSRLTLSQAKEIGGISALIGDCTFPP